jgi:ABC-type branched-subunit amino acid transport system ATPase component
MTRPILEVEGLTLRVQGKLVLKDLDFALPATGITALMGPVGTGKSTLIKWLCAKADPEIYSSEVRRAEYFYAPLSRRNRPLLYGQKLAQTFEQMMMHFSVLLSSNPPLICVDEPTAEMSAAESERVMERLAMIARSRALLLISHNQAQVHDYADSVMLLAGGRLQEITPTRQFFDAPQSIAGQQFVGSGWAVTAGVETPAHHLSHDLRALPFEIAVEPVGADGRLRSVCPGKIFVYDLPADLGALPGDADAFSAVGIDALICAERDISSVADTLACMGVTSIRLPDVEADAAFSAARARCRALQARLEAGGTLTFLRIGRGSVATQAIALQLVFMGVPADKVACIAATLQGDATLPPEAEQELWDFELARDLESDGVDPQGFRIDAPDISWIENQVPRSRAKDPASAPRLQRRNAEDISDRCASAERIPPAPSAGPPNNKPPSDRPIPVELEPKNLGMTTTARR